MDPKLWFHISTGFRRAWVILRAVGIVVDTVVEIAAKIVAETPL